MELDPAALAQPERYKLLIGTIVPRPIAVVSTRSHDGVDNLAPFSFFTGVGSNPMMVMFCPANRDDGQEKDTLRNAKPASEGGTGEFVVSLACEHFIHRIVAAAENLPCDQSEFDLTSLTRAPSHLVRPPRVAQSPAALECVTTQVIRTNPGQPGGGNVVLGRVVHVFVRDDLINDRLHIDQVGLHAVGRMGGLRYCTTTEQFELPPTRAAIQMPRPPR